MAGKKGVSQVKKGMAKENIVLLLPVIFLLTVFLFAVRAKIVPTYTGDLFWSADGDYAVDLYTNFRMIIFSVVTVVFVCYMLICFFTGKLQLNRHKVYIPMVVYVLFVLGSYALSENKDIALFGALSRFEGTVALFCYMGILFYSMNAIRSEKDVAFVVKCFAVACFVLGSWGILQVFGIGLENLPVDLYVPKSVQAVAEQHTEMDNEAVKWFFSNQNYSSFFMIFPVCIFALGCISAEDLKKKCLWAALTGLMLFNLWQSASLGGMVGLAVSVLAAFIIAGGKNILKWKKSLGLLVLAGIISVGASMPVIMREVVSGTKTDASVEEVTSAASEKGASLQFVEIQDIITDGSDVTFVFEDRTIVITVENDEIKSITDGAGKAVAEDNGILTASMKLHEDSGYMLLEADTANRTWRFIIVDEEAFFVSPYGSPIRLMPVERMGFEGNEGFATYRGYIWSRTFPLLKETLLFGKGADTYALHFPQHDYAGKYNIGYYNNDQDVVVDKPHNMYLGAAVNTGVISMIALIAIYVMYLIESFRIYWKRELKGFMEYIGMAIMIAIAGFMVSGLVNDSTVQMMPIVYVLLGMGFAINRMIKKNEDVIG